MPRTNAQKAETPESSIGLEEQDVEMPIETAETSPDAAEAPQDIDEILNSLKTLLSTVEKLQKVRQEVGDIKPLLLRMLDGELVSGEELDQLKTGVGGLMRLVRAHSDHQAALEKAQAARQLLDEVLKISPVS
ncbi:hypothetical protein [Leptolyngbya sp. FACHB-17]|uniref:hypothetical protein n=1 Tax=unclassified Leptolyngbya TaxID=2650499 RepID=UPI0016803759|nr:hypothetical protein [Leptolyngbya sp. FACHB-17]MBD2080895.1 hypothetical protein [Leptolyngbya sp. FACHB-17]